MAKHFFSKKEVPEEGLLFSVFAPEWFETYVKSNCKHSLKTSSGRTNFLSPIESHQLIQDKSEPMWNTMILVALRTGIRFGEILGLE